MKNEPNLKHFYYLLDDFGIWQHTEGTKIDRSMGYSLDDAARGLVYTGTIGLKNESGALLDYIDRSAENDSNFFTPKRTPIVFPMSDDALGQSYWAASQCINNGVCESKADFVLRKVKPIVSRIKNVRGKCYAILGAVLTDETMTRNLIENLKLEYFKNSNDAWPWIENELSYGNAIIPLAFLTAGEFLDDVVAEGIGLAMLDFLNKETKYKSLPIAIGNKTWYERDQEKSLYDQQPIDPAYQILANLKAYEISGDQKYLSEAQKYYDWFWGHNIAGESLMDASDGSCRDGIMETGLSNNRGAENVVCYLIAQDAYLKSSNSRT